MDLLYGFKMCNKDPKVSIVFTTYNAEKFIWTSLSAALAQDYHNFEVIVLDDGSDDATEDICRGISDSRLRYIKRDRIGRSAALNEAISLSTGDYIAINDADDLSFPFRLSVVMGAFMANKSLLLIGTDVIATDEFMSVLPEYKQCDNQGENSEITILNKELLYRAMPFAHSTVIFNKDAWHRVGGYDVNYTICIDYEFLLRIARHGEVGRLSSKTVVLFNDINSFYRSKKTSTYLKTLFFIKKQFRRDYKIPIKVRLRDVKYLKEYLR